MIGNRYKVKKSLGSGATAIVKLVEDIQTGKSYACKIMKTGKDGKVLKDTLQDIQKEAAITTQVHHPRMVNMIGTGLEKRGEREIYYIVMELAQEGELFDMVANKLSSMLAFLRSHGSMHSTPHYRSLAFSFCKRTPNILEMVFCE